MKADDCGRTFDPGRVTIRRLNRAEYNNTIRDLIGIDFHPADDFPSDDVGYGFDNIGDVLSMPPILMEKYLAAAETDQRRGDRCGAVGQGHGQDVELVRRSAQTQVAHRGMMDRLILTSESEIAVNHQFPRNAHYVIRVRACGDQAGPEPVRMAVRIDGKELKRFDVTGPCGQVPGLSVSPEPARRAQAALGRVSERLLRTECAGPQTARSEPDRRVDRSRRAAVLDR